MGIYITGMEMPTSCDDCRFAVDGWCYACIPESDAERQRITTNYCPLVPVPPHGRLIDVSDAVSALLRDNDYAAALTVSNCPTIIPASEEGET